MRRTLFWFGWIVLFALPIVFTLEALITQDVPRIEPWKWGLLAATVLVIYLSRNHDDVLKHHVV